MTPAGRLGVGIIGAGRVGPVLGAALAGAGHALVGISAVSQESRDRADAMLPGVPVLTVPELVERSELVLLAVPDDELEGLVAGLAEAGAWVGGPARRAHLGRATAPTCCCPPCAGARSPSRSRRRWPSPARASTSCACGRRAARSPRRRPCCRSGRRSRSRWAASPSSSRRRPGRRGRRPSSRSRSPLEAAVRAAATRLARLGVEEPDAVLGPMARSALERALGSARRPTAQEGDA